MMEARIGRGVTASHSARLREEEEVARLNPVSGYVSSTGSPNDGDITITVIRGEFQRAPDGQNGDGERSLRSGPAASPRS